jgi:ketosteroid isomerase-like protein
VAAPRNQPIAATKPALDTHEDPAFTTEMLALRTDWMAAEHRKDIAYLDHLLADEVVAGNAQGHVLRKSEILSRMKDPDRTLTMRDLHDVHVRRYGTTAIMEEMVTIDGLDHGKPFGGDYRFVRVFSHEGDRWRVVLVQGTPALKPPQP